MAGAFPPAASRVWVERFGPTTTRLGSSYVYLTLRNEGRPDLANKLVLTVDGNLLGGVFKSGSRYSVWEMTHQTEATVVAEADHSLTVVLDDCHTLGCAMVNETLVLRVSLQAQGNE